MGQVVKNPTIKAIRASHICVTLKCVAIKKIRHSPQQWFQNTQRGCLRHLLHPNK